VISNLSDDDRDELSGFFTAHAAKMFGYAKWLTQGETQLAEDLVQDAFQRAAQAWHVLRALTEDQRKQWLRTTIHNLAVSAFRHAAVVRDCPLDTLDQPLPADTHTTALSAIAIKQCWDVIERMPSRQHVVALMRWREGMKIREIAEALGMAEGTVSAHLAKARKELASELEPYLPFSLHEEGGDYEQYA
jgi:RNA polymerase sigma-70 factor (ECF subfamily)